MRKFIDWWSFQGEIKDMKSANHSERNKNYRGKILKKARNRFFKNLNKE